MKKAKNLIAFILVFVFSFSPYFPAQARFIPAEGPVAISSNSSQVLESALQDPLQNTLELLTLVRALNEKVFAEEELLFQEFGKEQGELEFLRRLTSKKRKYQISVEIPHVGKAELGTLGLHENGKVFTQITIERTQTVYLFLDADHINLDPLTEEDRLELGPERSAEESHLKRYLRGQLKSYVARQLVMTEAVQLPQADQGQLETKDLNFEDPNQISDEVLLKKNNLWKKAWMSALGENEPQKDKILIKGKDVVVVWYQSEKILKISEHKKPKSWYSYRYWRTYWSAIWEDPYFNTKYASKKVTKYFTGDYLLAWGSAWAQTGLALALSGLMVMTQNSEFNLAPAVLTLIWGSVYGVYNRTYRNWIQINPSHQMQTFKSWLVALCFSYTLIVVMQGWDAISLLTSAGLLMHAHLWLNNITKNWAKVWAMQIPLLREKAGESLDYFNIPKDIHLKVPRVWNYPFVALMWPLQKLGIAQWSESSRRAALWMDVSIFKNGLDLDVQRAGVELQAIQLPGNFLKLADMMHWQIATPMGNIPAGKLALYFSIPMWRFLLIRYAEKNGYKEAQELREDWEKDKAFGVPYLGLWGRVAKMIPQKILQWSENSLRYSARLVFSLTQAGQSAIKQADEYKKSKQVPKVSSSANACKSIIK